MDVRVDNGEEVSINERAPCFKTLINIWLANGEWISAMKTLEDLILKSVGSANPEVEIRLLKRTYTEVLARGSREQLGGMTPLSILYRFCTAFSARKDLVERFQDFRFFHGSAVDDIQIQNVILLIITKHDLTCVLETRSLWLGFEFGFLQLAFLLKSAAWQGRLNMIELVLQSVRQWEPGLRSSALYNALHFACLGRQGRTAKFLISNGASVNQVHEQGRSLLQLVMVNDKNEDCPGSSSSITLVSLLLEAGCKAETQDCKGNTPLHAACASMQPHFVERLLEWSNTRMANLHAIRNIDGRTPLHMVAASPCQPDTGLKTDEEQNQDQKQIIRLLAKSLANPTIQDNSGKTPLDLARMKGQNTTAAMQLRLYTEVFLGVRASR